MTALDEEVGGCSRWNNTAMQEQVNKSLIHARKARHVINPQNLYPMYHMVLHVNICGLALSNLGQLMTTQVIIGLVCMPVVSLLAAGFFARWDIWNEVLARSSGFELGDVQSLESNLRY